MNRIGILLASMLLLGLTAVCYSQNIGPQSRPLNQEDPKRPEAAPPRPEEDKPSQQEERPAKPEKESQRAQEHPRAGHEERGKTEEHGKTMEQGHARPAGKSVHIPDPKFKASFGRPHSFTVKRVITQTTIVPNQTQFVYGGYTFLFLDPWPSGWLFTDDCYIDFFDDEYFLVDVVHPGVRVALFVVG